MFVNAIWSGNMKRLLDDSYKLPRAVAPRVAECALAAPPPTAATVLGDGEFPRAEGNALKTIAEDAAASVVTDRAFASLCGYEYPFPRAEEDYQNTAGRVLAGLRFLLENKDVVAESVAVQISRVQLDRASARFDELPDLGRRFDSLSVTCKREG